MSCSDGSISVKWSDLNRAYCHLLKKRTVIIICASQNVLRKLCTNYHFDIGGYVVMRKKKKKQESVCL